MQADRPLILIVGGGIGGLALALALRDLDLQTVVWERAAELREVGAGLLLTSNAMWILDRLGLGDATSEAGHLIHRWQILDHRERVLQTLAFGGGRPISISISRAAFHDTLRQVLPPQCLYLDHEALAVERSPENGKVIVRSAAGDTCVADLVIGADGGKSRVRELIFPGHNLRDVAYVGWRALVDQVPNDWSDGRITESWGDGCRFGIAPVSKTRCYWYATENVNSGWSFPPGQRKAHLLERFHCWHRPICDLIEATPEDQILLNSIADHPRLPRWSRGRVALLGDAAHLMTPNLGQGAAMAMEDACVLAASLRKYGCNEAALCRYEHLRRWRTSRIAWQSRQVGRMIQIESRSLCRVRDTALKLTPNWVSMLAMAPIFRFRA